MRNPHLSWRVKTEPQASWCQQCLFLHCGYNPSTVCAITHTTDRKENAICLKTVDLKGGKWPGVSEVFHSKRRPRSWGKGNPVCTYRYFMTLFCKRMTQHGMRRAHRNQDDAPEEFPSTVFRTVTLQWPFARHSDGPEDCIPLRTFHWSARCALPSNAKNREGRRKNRPRGRPGTHRFLRLQDIPMSALCVGARDAVNLTNLFPTQQVLVFWDLVLLRKEYET